MRVPLYRPQDSLANTLEARLADIQRAEPPELRIVYDEDQAAPELPTNCAHCGARLPVDMGEWVLGVGADGAPGWLCAQECATGEDFPP